MEAPRRKFVTYGRRPNKAHDLFSKLESEDQMMPIQTPPSSRDTDSDLSAATPDRSDTAMFDIQSSDDEDLSESARKRRRLTPVSNNKSVLKRPTKMTGNATAASSTSVGPRRVQQPKAFTKKAVEERHLSPPPREQPIKTYQKKTYGREVVKEPAPGAFRSPSISPASRQSRSPSAKPQTPPSAMVGVDETIGHSSSSSVSIPTPEGTPRQVNRVQHLRIDKALTDSPSQLGLNRLHLKSPGLSSNGSPSDAEPQDTTLKAAKPVLSMKPKILSAAPRKRLIDALDSQKGSDQDDNHDDDLDRTDDKMHTERASSPIVDERSSSPPKPAPTATSSSQPIIPAGPKLTYGKQRSYLSESMVDEIVPAATGFSSQRSLVSAASQIDEFDMSDMDEDDNSGGGIRSIHELRKAGEAARFQGSLDSIFEDIASSLKGRRMTGYIQLGLKLRDASFRAQFLSHAMDQRLTKKLGSEDNVLELTLQCTALALLFHDDQASVTTVQNAAASMVPHLLILLQEPQSADVVAADRQQNLSKAIRKDLSAFWFDILTSGLWEGLPRPTFITPQLMALRLIELLIRRTRENDSNLDLPLTIVELLVDVLLKNNNGDESDQGIVCRMELIVSILESYTVKISDLKAAHVSVLTKLANLGPLLKMVSSASLQNYRQMQHLLLRLILNITNSNTVLCDAFAQPQLISAIMQIIVTDFIHLAPTGETKDEETDIVILSLGAAINLAEMSQLARSLISKLSPSPETPSTETFLDQMLSIFISNIEETEEDGAAAAETTTGTGQNLVAFGYLSVLLSILSVDPAALSTICSRLPGGDVSSLKAAMRDFLRHFKKVDQEIEGGVGEFMERFQGVLNGLDRASGVEMM